MGTRKSFGNVLLESSIHATPGLSSPLRRKSILPQKLPPSSLSVNDDEAERLARRQEITVSSTPNSSSTDKRRSLGLAFLTNMSSNEMTQRISQCIKLGAENKINPKNAFSLEMIDFMTYMIKKQDANMSNLQVASTSLDVSTKIYGFRVDGVHMEILKMIGGLEKQENREESAAVDGTDQSSGAQEGDENVVEKQPKKRKKRNKQRIFATADSLRINVETARPSAMVVGEADLQTTDMLYQAQLPNHANSGFYLHRYNDVIVDTVEKGSSFDRTAGCTIPRIEDFSDMEICPALYNFDFQDWTVDNEAEEMQAQETNESRFQFDIDASLPPDDDGRFSSMNYFDIENMEENAEENIQQNVDRCVRAPNEVENIVDFREVLTNAQQAKIPEYSFIQKGLKIHWAGPSHWKVSNFRKALSTSKVVGTCRQAPARKRKDVELHYEDETMERVIAKFSPSQAIKVQAKTAKTEWTEAKLTLPPDIHYDIVQAFKCYLHSTMIRINEDNAELNATHVSDSSQNYDYNNDNDMANHLPDVNNDDFQGNEQNDANDVFRTDDGFRSEDDGVPGTQMPLTGENLVAVPKLANKIAIAYSLRAKKIDMRQLKKSIWTCLTATKEKENIDTQEMVEQEANKINDSKHFSKIYKSLPGMLSKSNAEALSFPISFVSLLHLANEKTLKVHNLPDMSDLIVKSD